MHNFLGTKHDLYFFLATVLRKGCVVFLTGVRVLVVGVLVTDSRALSRARFILVRLLAVRLFMYFLAVNFSLFDANEYFSSTFVSSWFEFDFLWVASRLKLLFVFAASSIFLCVDYQISDLSLYSWME